MLKQLIYPTSIEQNKMEDHCKEFTFEPLERGYGYTLGNALKETMLKCLPGTAVTSVGVSVAGQACLSMNDKIPMRESIEEILANIQDISFLTEGSAETLIMKLEGQAREIKAGDLTKKNTKIINADHVIGYYDGTSAMSLTINIENGVGFIATSKKNGDCFSLGVIFSPVLSAEYQVSETRVGSKTDYNKLVFIVKTNGSISPELAIMTSASILQDEITDLVDASSVNKKFEDKGLVDEFLLLRVDALDLSARSQNCLYRENILYVGDLVQKTKKDLISTPNFGKKSLSEIQECLENKGYSLGTRVPGWESIKQKITQ